MKKQASLKIGIAQLNPTVGDFNGNQRKILGYVEEADRHGLDLVVFPELAVSGYPVWDLASKPQFVKAGLEVLKAILRSTRRKHVAVVIGLIDLGKKKGGKNRNALMVVRDGKVIHCQYKTLLPNYDVFLEQIYFEPGNDHRLFTLKNWRIGTTICEDIWDDAYPVKPAKILRAKGADLLINISASPFHRHVAEIRDRLIRRQSKENSIWLVYANQTGGQDDLVFDGRSIAAEPGGRIIFRAPAFEEGLFSFEIGSGTKKSLAGTFNADEEIKDMYRALVLGIRDYVRKNRFQKVVIGLSGGIDSALVATLAADALGPQAVVGVTMPGEYSSRGSFEDSGELAKNLGIEFRQQPILSNYEQFVEYVKLRKRQTGRPVPEDNQITLAMENLQARLRGLELMYISNDENCLLLSTGNKSEMAMGYCTLYGDMCGGLCVIGDVYKTDVYRLVQYRNSISPVIPKVILEKAPSAELRPDQKDQDSLPPYDVLDAILIRYIEKNLGEAEIVRQLKTRGVERSLIASIIKKVDHNEYKRRQSPPIIRVSEKAWFGRRMPITNRFE